MATDIRTSLERVLECPICHEQMRDATILQCGHSFCKSCLTKLSHHGLLATLLCPCCRNMSPYKLNPNVTVNNIMDVLDRTDKPGCSTSPLALCMKHPNIEKKYVCQRCKIDMCSECAISDHFNHDGSPPKTLEAIKKDVMIILNKKEHFINTSAAFELRVEGMQQNGVGCLAKLEREVNREYDRCVHILSQAKERMVSSIKDEEKKMKTSVNDLLSKQSITVRQVTDDSSRASIGVKRGAPKDVIDVYTSYAKKLKKSIDEGTPSTDEADKQLGAIKALCFEKGRRGDISIAFGRICKLRENEESDRVDEGLNSSSDEGQTSSEDEGLNSSHGIKSYYYSSYADESDSSSS